MQIFYLAVGDKLKPRPELPRRSLPECWFWVVHGGSQTAHFFKEEPRANHCLAKGGAILFLSSARYGGLGSEAAARAIERGHNGRVYCLRAACTATSAAVHDHLENFLETVSGLSAGVPIPWREAETPRVCRVCS